MLWARKKQRTVFQDALLNVVWPEWRRESICHDLLQETWSEFHTLVADSSKLPFPTTTGLSYSSIWKYTAFDSCLEASVAVTHNFKWRIGLFRASNLNAIFTAVMLLWLHWIIWAWLCKNRYRVHVWPSVQQRKSICTAALNAVDLIPVLLWPFISFSQGMVETKLRKEWQVVLPALRSMERIILYTADRYWWQRSQAHVPHSLVTWTRKALVIYGTWFFLFQKIYWENSWLWDYLKRIVSLGRIWKVFQKRKA